MHGFAAHALFVMLFAPLLVPVAALAAPVDVRPYLQIKGQSGPSLSPDGSSIAYSFAGSGVAEVWVAVLRGDAPRQITTGPERADFKAWSPNDDKLILFGRDRGGDENWGFWSITPTGERLRALLDEPGVQNNWGGYSFDGTQIAYASNVRNRQYFDVYTIPVVAAEGSAGHLVYQADGDNRPEAWSRDGKHVLISARTDNFNNDLLLADVRNAGGAPRLLTQHTGRADFESCGFSRDDAEIYCISDYGGREHRGLAVIDAKGVKPIRFLDNEPYDLDQLALSRDGTKLALIRNRDGYGRLTVLDVASGATIATPALPDGVAAAPTFSNDGRMLAFDFSGPAHPSAIWTYRFADNKTEQMTTPQLAGIDSESFVEPRLVSFPSFDGRPIPAWYYTPRVSRGKLSVVIDVHGGPEAQARPVFNPIVQFFVASGYAVLVPNVRGSLGYGNT
jgi:dipeptidyl aminopeptidase/acylaminoacyl peptidase